MLAHIKNNSTSMTKLGRLGKRERIKQLGQAERAVARFFIPGLDKKTKLVDLTRTGIDVVDHDFKDPAKRSGFEQARPIMRRIDNAFRDVHPQSTYIAHNTHLPVHARKARVPRVQKAPKVRVQKAQKVRVQKAQKVRVQKAPKAQSMVIVVPDDVKPKAVRKKKVGIRKRRGGLGTEAERMAAFERDVAEMRVNFH